MSWRGWDNAERYDRFVREGGIYRALNAACVDVVDVAAARSVLDLACGTGATAEAALARMGRDAELVGVDASPEMVEVARTNVPDPRARFAVAAAADVAEVTPGPFDAALCNAAFWQFPSAGAVLRAVVALLAPGARFVFNVPCERLRGHRPTIHAFQAALAREIERRTGAPMPTTATSIDPAVLERAIDDAGLALVRRERHVVRTVQRELAELMTLPAMIRPIAPALDEEALEETVEAARRRVDLDEPVEVAWAYFVVERPVER